MILVDECQDTDPLQTEIVFFLSEDGARAERWRDVRIAPGKLLFVGDPKQSIYRFRRGKKCGPLCRPDTGAETRQDKGSPRRISQEAGTRLMPFSLPGWQVPGYPQPATEWRVKDD
jgi:hypothetical protein